MYITPCPLLFLPCHLYINLFYDSLHHSMYLFIPSLTPSFYVYHSIILCISSFPLLSILIPSMIHSIILCISSFPLLSILIPSMIHSIILCISSFPLLPISIPTEIHSIILCISLPAPSSSFPLPSK